uniref:Uncharacterized protein n=1 Tax=Chromera velia CCMP2878 TaxID=1169474 RepID=A0A0K6S758_9ALVE|eukprot:Cvel_3832.t2-p1 / transcript=Cvel_3832.t2 / gene=Cvel_3832 / organism=Chromera_velia_CCMP2878 / gene_product=hypothetical protein / transcript_product=hypothetical protein / location=Cvel_scaffold162:21110-23833(+) / protein_length=306 / sequence_SO=supercontig / SO=protein_coding / is_pseudo=false
MKQEYSLTLLAMQLAVQERVQDLVFPWLLDHHDWNGRVVIPSGVVLSFAKIDQKLKDLLFDSDDAEWEIADPTKVIMIVNALTDDQRMKLVNSLRSKLPGLGGQLDLRQIDYATLKKELEWFASFDWDAEIKARQRQSGGRERAFRGQQRWGEARGGGMKWVVKKPVVDSRCSRHFFSSLRDVKSCVVEVRETDSEFVGVEGDVARAESDVTMDLPGVEYVDGAAPADGVDRFSGFNVDENREVDVLAAGGADPEAVVSSSKSQAIFPDSVPSTAVRRLDRIVGESVSSVSAPVPFLPPFVAGSQL